MTQVEEKNETGRRETFETALASRANSFGVLRLVLASLVIVDHAFPLGGFGRDPLWARTRGQTSFGSIAVLGFFAISGYLIAKSAARLDVLQYVWHRVLRIFPAYWTALVVGAFVVGPLVWIAGDNPIGTYVNRAINGPLSYVWSNADLGINTYGIHNIFATTTPYGLEVGASVLNGSIWTLIYEWRCYLIVGVLALGAILTKHRSVLLGGVTAVGVLQLAEAASPGFLAKSVPILSDPQLLPLVFVFLVGSTFAAYRDRIVVDHRLGLFSFFVLALTLRYGGFVPFGLVAGAYAVLYLAAKLPPVFQRVGAKNDYSYGIYVYGFLVQQTLAYLGVYRWGYIPFVVVALAVSAGLAWLSWHAIEKRALALKAWGPGKGLRYWTSNVRTKWNRLRPQSVE
jgi:peptidoglycan/LPS O-acetylase OafA/YrhL